MGDMPAELWFWCAQQCLSVSHLCGAAVVSYSCHVFWQSASILNIKWNNALLWESYTYVTLHDVTWQSLWCHSRSSAVNVLQG